MTGEVHPRYAIYYAPEPSEPLAAFGRTWLGYDAESGQRLNQPEIAGRDAAWLAEITAAPRLYGFHGTLKPPFLLATGTSENGLLAAADAFATATQPVEIGLLEAAEIDGFIALAPISPPSSLLALAADCVRAFDRFRAPATAAELARRRQAALTPRQDELLKEWGYPYVMEEFRFHLTLTRRLNRAEREILMPHIQALISDCYRTPVRIGGLAIFRQPSPEESFKVLARVPFAGAKPRSSPRCA
jgi:putative phosphonate metabolism protein